MILTSGVGMQLILPTLSLVIWIYLLGWRGQFWQADCRLESSEANLELAAYPTVAVVIPARDEAETIGICLRSLLKQDYRGNFTITLVDDRSSDGTGMIAEQVATEMNERSRLQVITGQPLPAGWSGKLWAVNQGVEAASTNHPQYILLTDADIAHDGSSISRLVAKAERENLDMVSAMVQLRCEEAWEIWLIPAFVFFFQKLYPFRWVNQPQKSTAAAAGGCILIRREALERIGGIQTLRSALIDDCALATAVKIPQQQSSLDSSNSQGKIWLGLSSLTHSLRPYPSLSSIWKMVARTAYTQLNYSLLLLIGTLLAMTIIYLVPPLGTLAGLLVQNWSIMALSLAAWLLMALSYLPTLKLYERSPWLALGLPAIAFLYTLMTLDSAIQHWQGRGGAWKGRVYSA